MTKIALRFLAVMLGLAFAAGVIFLLAWIFAPREGLLARRSGKLDEPEAV
mgnify:CR=1 FL=1